ncbi:MAG: response regulator transcription factor [Ignavibacteria bacterium]|jgi:DNA-binding NarL/FixJ family response regulator
MKKIRLIIIEDNKLLREGIRVMVKEQKDIRVVAALGDRIKVHDKIRDLKPNVLLLDLGLVNQNSLELVKSLKKNFPKLKIIVMDLLPIQSDIIKFIEEGVSGFILKDATTEDFMNTIRSVAKGVKIFPSQLHGSLFSEIVDNAVNELMDSKLIESIRMTENEKKIIEFISAGFTDKEIAKKLRLTISIVKGHIDNILEKMSLNTHVQIAVYRNSGGDSFDSTHFKPVKAKILKKDRTKLRLLRA